MKIGEKIKFKEDFEIKTIVSEKKLQVKKGDKCIVTKDGLKVLNGEARGKILNFHKSDKVEGYDYENIADMIFNRLNAMFGLDMYLDEEELERHDFVEEIADVLMDIL